MTRVASFYNCVNSKQIPNFTDWFAREDGVISNPHRQTIRGSRNKDGYCCYIDPGGGQHYIHRLVAKTWIFNKRPDIFKEVDHINGIKHDNRVANLRWSNRTIQNLNRDFKGWEYNPRWKKYKAQCIVHGVKHKLGWFKTSAEAHSSYVSFKNKKIQEIYDYYYNEPGSTG
jgi:hypothetical protein